MLGSSISSLPRGDYYYSTQYLDPPWRFVTMSTINANTALQILRTELQEIESRILEGQVTYNPRRRMGRGSFGDVYRGQHEGTVSQ